MAQSWQIPVLSQRTAFLCWEACARMMWQWRYKNLTGYAAKAGDYATMNVGLTERQLDPFYTQLGMRSLVHPKGANLRHALKWTPVIFTDINNAAGHAMVLSGYDGKRYSIVNPCAAYTVDFDSDTDTCTAGIKQRIASEVEDPLGLYMWYW